VRGLRFTDHTLAHTAYHLPEGGSDGRQAVHSYYDHWTWQNLQQMDFNGSLFAARYWREGSLSGVICRAAGYHGLQIGTGCKDVSITGCQVSECGGNGILIGTLFDPANDDEHTRNINLNNSLVETIGRQFAGAVGIWQGFAADCEIAYNRIRHLPYSGISVGWRWDSTSSMAQGNRVTGNHVSDVMLLLGDGGGIYTLGHQPGSAVRDNLIHGIARSPLNKASPNNGIYPDQGSSGITYAGNIIYDIAASPVRCHARDGMNVDVLDNVLVPSEQEVAGVMSPPYENRVYFRAGDESLTEQVRWWGNTILTPEAWAQASADILADRHFGPRSPWRERFGLD
jgi:hypothetical protein